ncbi:MAG: YabP/YqfC family sporulation protein [Clostridia bacterium]|nr:YabP/YqfC family sporulation protein [Clostridia bacterium]
MFNFFNEIKKDVQKINEKTFGVYTIINLSGKMLYVEGHTGLLSLSKEIISFKVKRNVITVYGTDMILSELSENTIKITGEINNVEKKQ